MTIAPHSIHVMGSRKFGGAEQFFMRLLRGLHARGQGVTAVSRKGTAVAHALEDADFPQVHLPLATQWDLYSLWRLRRLINAQGACIVQTYMGRATRLTRLPKNSPAVHVARLGGFYKIDGYYRHAHAWVGNTRGICDYLVRSGLPAHRVFHIGNFVPPVKNLSLNDVERFRSTLSIDPEAWVFLGLGRLVAYKGFEDLLQALTYLPEMIATRPWVLLVAGEGPYKAHLQRLARELGLENHVRWLGWQDPPDLCYAMADLFICPSRIEPLGNVILEAWAHALPVLSTRSDGALELIDDGATGILHDSGDVRKLAEQIEDVLRMPERDRQSLGLAGQVYCEQHFSQASVLDAYTSLYEQLLTTAGH